MVTISADTKVGEAAGAIPASIPVFQKYGIDYCCGGGRTIAQACSEKGVSVDTLLANVEGANFSEVVIGIDWNQSKLADLIDHILDKHHVFLRRELPRLAQMLAKVIAVHGANHSESLQPLGEIFSGLQKELEEHMWKEENILFPLIRRIEAARLNQGPARPEMSPAGPIRVMEMEHDSAGHALEQMREVTSDYQLPGDACSSYRGLFQGLEALEADLKQHIHLENNVLFPRTKLL